MKNRLLALVLVVPALLLGPAAQAAPDRATQWYLALGDSLTAGVQVDGAHPEAGFARPVAAALDKTKLHNLGCPGETSTTLVDGGRCTYDEGNQLDQALQFLHAHGEKTTLVTLTVGANDVTPCLTQVDIVGCVQGRLVTLQANVARILTEVRAASPATQVVVTNYYNPYLAAWFTNPQLAGLTSALQTSLNAVIAGVSAQAGADVADVSTAFRSFDTTPVNGVPTNVLEICRLTWMCSANNIHANDAGYAVMATAILAKVGQLRRPRGSLWTEERRPRNEGGVDEGRVSPGAR